MRLTHKLTPDDNPFDLANEAAYRAWADARLEACPASIGELMVEIRNPKQLSPAEKNALLDVCRRANMVLYAGPTGHDADRSIPLRLAQQLGLSEPDDNWGADEGITALQVVEGDWRSDYVPYTNRGIHWHTDGYYNTPARQIHALMLHCVSPAAEGGENALLDHELAYIHLRDRDPAFIQALMAPDAMTIPANVDAAGVVRRPDRTGPVFSVSNRGRLHMRYTARRHNVVWKDDPLTRAAVAELKAFMASDSPYIFRATLQAGQGLISNNVLHDRSAFEDRGEYKRLLYRLRYYTRVTG